MTTRCKAHLRFGFGFDSIDHVHNLPFQRVTLETNENMDSAGGRGFTRPCAASALSDYL